MTTVAGGVYGERCVEPHWDDVYGSGGRAAAAMSGADPDVRLMTYQSEALRDGLENLEAAYGLRIEGPSVDQAVEFDYVHSLADPRITPRPDAIAQQPPIEVDDDVVLRFGMMEGSARVRARRAVYDPQSAFNPRPFAENGSKADELAVILNRLEGRKLTGESDPTAIVDAIFADGLAAVVVLKMGGHGAMVASPRGRTVVPAYMSDTVWKVGSGDVFSSAFTRFWARDGADPDEAAELASRATSHYVGTRSLPTPGADALRAMNAAPVTPGSGRVYLASPFFNLAERWLVEEVRAQLTGMGVDVFSPLHDVGVGAADQVAMLDLEGLDGCDVVLAILNGGDTGTVFEVGYAVAKGKRVVALAQNTRPEDLKMPVGAGCRVVGDVVSAIYHAVWALK